jgi:hypothetical protein
VITISAVVTKLGGLAERSSLGGRVRSSFDDLDLSLEDAAIDVDHDPTKEAGSLVYAELGTDERLRVVGVVDEWVATAAAEHDIYVSGIYEHRGRVRGNSYVAAGSRLLRCSLTLSPASLEAQPLRWRAGDLRSELERGRWPVSWRSDDPLLARAVDEMAGIPCTALRQRTAARIIDRRPDPDVPPPLRPGERLRAPRPLPGGLRRSGGAGQILAVR